MKYKNEEFLTTMDEAELCHSIVMQAFGTAFNHIGQMVDHLIEDRAIKNKVHYHLQTAYVEACNDINLENPIREYWKEKLAKEEQTNK